MAKTWLEALRILAKMTGKYIVPRKGTKEYQAAKDIQEGKAVKLSAKGKLFAREGEGGMEFDADTKGRRDEEGNLRPTVVRSGKKVKKLVGIGLDYEEGDVAPRKARSDKGQKRSVVVKGARAKILTGKRAGEEMVGTLKLKKSAAKRMLAAKGKSLKTHHPSGRKIRSDKGKKRGARKAKGNIFQEYTAEDMAA